MEATRVRLLRPEAGQAALAGALLALALVAWAVTDEWMRGMDAGPGTDLGALGFYVAAWVVMMAAMMFPSILPMVLLYARVQRRRRATARTTGATEITVFVSGYLVTWAAFGLLAYGAFALVESLSIGAFSWERGGPYLAGSVIAAAAVYQLSPWKDACLTKCRTPLTFLLERWREGHRGALRLGIEHGGWCVGCCWALMAALFALGVMSVGWMIFIAALIAVEKLLPWRRPANLAVAGLLLMLGLAVAIAPGHVPGLTLPDEASMMQMGGPPGSP